MSRDTSMKEWSGPVIRILSIDGGGMRGVIPARVIVELERLTGQPIASLFDVIAGTSTGGMIALALSRPGAGGSPALTAQDILDVYTQHGAEIFPRVDVRGLRSRQELSATRTWLAQRVGAMIRPRRYGNARYSATGLESVLDGLLGVTPLSASLTEVLIPTYDWKAGRAVVFRSREAREGASPDPAMAMLARATAAAPTYFPPVRYIVDGREMILIDGGFVANNPASIAYYEALCLERLRDEDSAFVMVSIGTGRPPEVVPTYEEIWSRNWLKLAMGMLGVAFDATTEVTDDLLSTIIGGRWRRGRYWRLQTDLLGVNLDLDDASERNVQGLEALGDRLVIERGEDLNEIAQLLIQHPSHALQPASPSLGSHPL
ncbi:MAG: patatin-like phospholipase family protein [Gaiellales bacterium]